MPKPERKLKKRPKSIPRSNQWTTENPTLFLEMKTPPSSIIPPKLKVSLDSTRNPNRLLPPNLWMMMFSKETSINWCPREDSIDSRPPPSKSLSRLPKMSSTRAIPVKMIKIKKNWIWNSIDCPDSAKLPPKKLPRLLLRLLPPLPQRLTNSLMIWLLILMFPLKMINWILISIKSWIWRDSNKDLLTHRHHSRQDLFPNIDSFAHKSVQQGLIDTENEHNRVYKKQKHNASNNFSSKNPNYFSIDERRRKFRFAKATPKK